MPLFQNKYRIESIRLSGWDYRTAGLCFVTICTHQRARILGRIEGDKVLLSAAGRIAEADMRELAAHYNCVSVDKFVVMPNHVHAIIAIEGDHMFTPKSAVPAQFFRQTPRSFRPKAGSLSAIVRSYKAGVARGCHELGFRSFAWQSRFYERIVRNDVSLNAIRTYIEENPINWRLDPDIRK
jgi:putative transposase